MSRKEKGAVETQQNLSQKINQTFPKFGLLTTGGLQSPPSGHK
jgi:hypothetical protein